MIFRLVGKLIALPIRVAAVPFRILDKSVGVDDNVHEVTPGTVLRELAQHVEDSIGEIK